LDARRDAKRRPRRHSAIAVNISHDMRCAHCGRELAGVAMLFPGTPAVCGRADCLGWARALAVAPSATSGPVDVAVGGKVAA
jgi:hypothetical protein